MKKFENTGKIILLIVTILTLLVATTKSLATDEYDDLSQFVNATNNTTSNTTTNNTTNTTTNNTANRNTSTTNNSSTGTSNSTSNRTSNNTTNNTANRNTNTATNRNHLGNEGVGDSIGGVINTKMFGIIITVSVIVAIFTYKKIKDYSNI